MERSGGEPRHRKPVRAATDEIAKSGPGERSAARPGRPLARVRVPLTLTHRPWAVLLELPDGRCLWEIRLWYVDRPRLRRVSTGRLLRYAEQSGLRELVAELIRRGGAEDA